LIHFYKRVCISNKIAMMSLLSAKLPQSLGSTSSIPTDVKFVFKEEKKGTTSVEEIKAHKVILAVVSDVFEKEFFGPLKEVKNEIEIKDIKRDVFEAMIDFVYNKNPFVSSYELQFLSSLFYVAEKYNISALKNEIIASIIKKEVLDENVLDIAIIAEMNVIQAEFSERLYDRVAQFLMKKFAGKLNNAIEYFSQTEATQANGLVLLKAMARMKTISPPLCENCKAYPCMDGVGVSKANFVSGAKVANTGRGCNEVDKLVRIIDHMNQFTAVMKDGDIQCGWSLSPAYYVYKCE